MTEEKKRCGCGQLIALGMDGEWRHYPGGLPDCPGGGMARPIGGDAE